MDQIFTGGFSQRINSVGVLRQGVQIKVSARIKLYSQRKLDFSNLFKTTEWHV